MSLPTSRLSLISLLENEEREGTLPPKDGGRTNSWPSKYAFQDFKINQYIISFDLLFYKREKRLQT